MKNFEDLLKMVKTDGMKFRTFHVIKEGNEIGKVTVVKSHTSETIKNGLTLPVIAMTFCSPKDIYNKTKGQLIAAGRLAKVNKRFFIPNGSVDIIKKVIVAEAKAKRIKWMEGITEENLV